MMVINSVTNKNVQFVKKLAQRKYRKSSNLFIVEGLNTIKDLPEHINVHSLYIAESKMDIYSEFLHKFSCPLFVLSDRVFQSVSDTVTPSGILAVLPYHFKELRDIKSNAIVLDGISDSGNLGTIIRTAAAFGYRDIVLINSADPYSGKCVRSSMGGILRVNLYESNYLDINALDYEIITLDMKGENIENVLPPEKYLLIIGNEAHGISDFFRNKAKFSVSIKMSGDIESLNAAVSAGIAMYMFSNKNVK